MASYRYDAKAGSARVVWRFNGGWMSKTILVRDEDEARLIALTVEQTIQDIERGRLSLPDGADLKAFLVSGGKVAATASVRSGRSARVTFADLVARYEAEPLVHLEGSTTKTVRTHLRRILDIFPATASLETFDAQTYVNKRAKSLFRGRPIQRKTIHMELQTFRQVWDWVASRSPGVVKPTWSPAGLSFPKARPIKPFMTWDAVERVVKRGGLSKDAIDELWDGLWLDKEQVRQLLEHVRGAGAPGFFHPMITAAAYTGARRSELCRSEIGDWDLEAGQVGIRQKKRDRDRELSFRRVRLHAELAAVMAEWFAAHPGGQMAFARDDRTGVTWDEASHHFPAALDGSRWSVVRGWHVLRHSFASNLAAAGVDQRLIDSFMGHSTEVRLRYQHVRPGDAGDAINKI
jgi:integrase